MTRPLGWAPASGMPQVRPAVRSLALAAAAGLLWGLVSSLVNIARVPWLEALSHITGQSWSWCVFAFCIGFALRRAIWSPIYGVASMVAAMVGYYGTDLLRGVYTQDAAGVMWGWFWSDLISWSQLGVVAGVAFGLAGSLTRRGGIIGAIASLALPSTVMYPAVAAGLPLGSMFDHPGLLTWLTLAAVAVSVLLFVRAVAASLLRLRRGPGLVEDAQTPS